MLNNKVTIFLYSRSILFHSPSPPSIAGGVDCGRVPGHNKLRMKVSENVSFEIHLDSTKAF